MDLLWAPWREEYVVRVNKKLRKGCTFCSVLKENKDEKNYILLRSKLCFAVLNIYPFNGGHVMVLPKRHVDDLDKLTPAEMKDMMALVVKVKARIKETIRPDAFNIGFNLGSAAGAGIPQHMHIHIVPRWKGDMNFMPAVFGTKVMPVSLERMYQVLVDAN
ncbi:MAG: HIT domain-containing protein [Candidatus Omnitrophica bacterium]|nr:HIT domain-containing protein [Candidatus Omnitrophota bacterium]